MSTGTFQIVRLVEALPGDFEALRREAEAEAYRFVESLLTAWRAGDYAAGDDRFAASPLLQRDNWPASAP